MSIKLTLGDSKQLLIEYYEHPEDGEITYYFGDVGDIDGTIYYSLTKDLTNDGEK